MNNYIGAKLENLPVKYGFYNFGEVRELAVSSFGYVMNDLMSIRTDFIILGFHLREIRVYGYFRDFGYHDFYEFCERNFNLKKTTINNYILVHETFCARNGAAFSNRLDERYSDYSFTQLVELCSIPPDERKNYPPTMTVEEMREKKRSDKNKNIAPGTSDPLTGQTISKKNYLSVSDLCDLKGIVLQNKIKKVDSLCQRKIVIYDENGKQLHSYKCDVIMNGNILRFRIRN